MQCRPGCGALGQGSSINHQRRGDGPGLPSAPLNPRPPCSSAINWPLLPFGRWRTCSSSTNGTAFGINNTGCDHRILVRSWRWTNYGLKVSRGDSQGERRVLVLIPKRPPITGCHLNSCAARLNAALAPSADPPPGFELSHSNARSERGPLARPDPPRSRSPPACWSATG